MHISLIHPILQIFDPYDPIFNLLWVLLHHKMGLGLHTPKLSSRKQLHHHPLLSLLLWLHHIHSLLLYLL